MRLGLGLGLARLRGSSIDPAAAAYFAATGLTGATEKAAVNTLVRSLKSAGLWSKMKAVYPFVTDNRNLLSYTEDLGNGYWFQQSTTVTTNTTTSPSGTLTADTASFSSSTPSFVRASSIPINSGQTYTISVYVKQSASGGANNIRITTNNTIAWNTGITQKFALTTSWQRITLTGVLTSSANVSHILFGSTNIDGTVDATCGGSVDIWGAQLDLGSTATTYQPIATTQQSYISNQFKYNLVNPVDSDAAFRGVFNGGWTFSYQGALPNGTNGYMDTYLIPSTSLTAHNIHLSYYSRTNSAVASSNTMGSASSEYCRLVVRRTSDIAFNIISDATVGLSQYTVTDSRGLFVANAPSINTRKFYQNGVVKTPVSQTTLGTNGLSTNKIVLAANNNGVILEYDNKQSAFSSIGDGLTDTEATALYNAVQTFNTSLSRQV